MKAFNSNTDREWEKYGRYDPYFGVLTHDRFRLTNLTDENKREFFKSGCIYIDDIVKKIKKHIEPNFAPKQALDFGCGVGRLVIPLADIAEQVTGVDVSYSMLNEAKKNCDARDIKNVVLLKSDDSLSSLTSKYDFIHSFIVFQHIPVTRGEQLFQNLIAHLELEGVCVVHFPYAEGKQPILRKCISFVKKHIPLTRNFINLIKGRSFGFPEMQMNAYDLNHVFLMIQKANVLDCYAEFMDHGGVSGIVVYFKKLKTA